MSMTSFQRMKVSAAPSVEATSGLFILSDTSSKRHKELDTDTNKEDHYRSDVNMIERDARYSSGNGEYARRRKVKKEDKSWRKDRQERRTNGWDSEWGPSSSCENSEEKYVLCTIKLRESPEFMKREEEGFFDQRDMAPVKRASQEWNMCKKDDGMGLEPTQADGILMVNHREWVEGGLKTKPPPPPPPPLPPTSQKEKQAFQVMTKNDHQDYSKLASLESLTEEDPIPEWALQMDAPKAPIVLNPETSFAEHAPLEEHEAFDGHATLKKGTPCYLCREVTFFSGLAWTYCKASPPIPNANRTRYDLKTVVPKNTDVNQVIQLQKVKDKAIRRRQELLIMGRPRTDELEDEFHSLKKTNDGSIRLVCFRCWNEFENTDKYATANGKPSSALRKKSAVLLNTEKMRQKYLQHWEIQRWKLDDYVIRRLTDSYGGAADWVTAVGPGENVVQLYSCAACGNAPLRTNGWLKAKTCSAGSYVKTQWHCPHCCNKCKWGASAHDRWILIYSSNTDQHPAHFTWGYGQED
eukprot:2983661-Amphidinium_carterae.1